MRTITSVAAAVRGRAPGVSEGDAIECPDAKPYGRGPLGLAD
jgi:hypothetical protein